MIYAVALLTVLPFVAVALLLRRPALRADGTQAAVVGVRARAWLSAADVVLENRSCVSDAAAQEVMGALLRELDGAGRLARRRAAHSPSATRSLGWRVAWLVWSLRLWPSGLLAVLAHQRPERTADDLHHLTAAVLDDLDAALMEAIHDLPPHVETTARVLAKS